MTRIIFGIIVLACAVAVAFAYGLISYGSGWSDNQEATAYFIIGTCGGILATLGYGSEP